MAVVFVTARLSFVLSLTLPLMYHAYCRLPGTFFFFSFFFFFLSFFLSLFIACALELTGRANGFGERDGGRGWKPLMLFWRFSHSLSLLFFENSTFWLESGNIIPLADDLAPFSPCNTHTRPHHTDDGQGFGAGT
ncbi:hypothetical protein B0T19DRAFT_27964 [Cercophora scortea]|uniref:Uncharacterized protein n=1 Tax=Cercophora scortea TaxID=314031 RepID=A0AAE0MKR0_9PEZI|nr:hypothetical protein B0T19DRAFT_27964 [Cercophora scortea]